MSKRKNRVYSGVKVTMDDPAMTKPGPKHYDVRRFTFKLDGMVIDESWPLKSMFGTPPLPNHYNARTMINQPVSFDKGWDKDEKPLEGIPFDEAFDEAAKGVPESDEAFKKRVTDDLLKLLKSPSGRLPADHFDPGFGFDYPFKAYAPPIRGNPVCEVVPGVSFQLGFRVLRVRVENPRPAWLSTDHPSYDNYRVLNVTFETWCRDTSAYLTLDYRAPIPANLYDSAGFPLKEKFSLWLQTEIGKLAQHEIDEGIKVDGKRVFDPHAPLPLTFFHPLPPGGVK